LSHRDEEKRDERDEVAFQRNGDVKETTRRSVGAEGSES